MNARIAIRALVRFRVMVDWVRLLRVWMRRSFSEGVSGFIPRDSWRILSWVVSFVGVGDDDDDDVEVVSLCALLFALEMKSGDDD